MSHSKWTAEDSWNQTYARPKKAEKHKINKRFLQYTAFKLPH